MADGLEFAFELIDKASGPAEKIASGLGGVNSALKDADRTSRKMGKLEKAVAFSSIAAHSLMAANGVVQLTKAFGGFEKLKAGVVKMGQGIKVLGAHVAAAAKKVAPFAIGAAGIYGLGKVAGAVALPALTGVVGAIAAVTAASAIATVAVGGLVVKLGADLTKSAVGAAAFREQTEKAFSALLKGEDGAKRLDRIKMIAATMGTEFQDTAIEFKRLFAKGFSPKEAEMLFLRMQDLKGVAGVTEGEISRALLAIGQIKNVGKLQGDELNQLADAGVPVGLVYEEIAKAAGKTIPEIMKMKEAGKITSDMALGAVEKAIGSLVGSSVAGQAGKEIADTTWAGMVNRLKNMKTGILDDLAVRIFPTFKAMLPMVKDVIDGITGAKAPGAGTWTDKLAGGIRGVLDLAIRAWPIVKAFANGVSQGFGFVWDAVQQVGGAFTAVFGGGDKAAALDKMGKIALLTGKGLAIAAGAFAAVGVAALGAISAVGGFIGMITSSFGLVVEKMFLIGSNIVGGLSKGLRAGIGQIKADALALAAMIPDPIRKFLGIHSPSKPAIGIGMNWGKGLAIGQHRAEPMVADASESLARVIMPSPVAAPVFGSQQTASPASAGRPVNVYLTVPAGPGATREDAQTMAEHLAPHIERHVRRIFEGLSA